MTCRLKDLWDESKAGTLSSLDLLVYRSNLLGSDPRVVNTAGGNTSAKLTETDPLTGEPCEVLWVKGSGGDLRTGDRSLFASLYLERLLSLRDRYPGAEGEDEMVALYPHCTFNLNPRAASIDTPLHAFLPEPHVDHTHPDAVIALAASDAGEAATREIFGGKVLWAPWRRPGFELALRLRALYDAHPGSRGIVLENHGLISWGKTSLDCYRNTLGIIAAATDFVEGKVSSLGAGLFGGIEVPAVPPARRREILLGLLPVLRGKLARADGRRPVLHVDASEPVLRFVGSRDAKALAALGTSCPDHFLRTKIRPLYLPFRAGSGGTEELLGALDPALADFRSAYGRYYEANREKDSPAQRDPNPSVVLVPGLGMITAAKDKPAAEVTAEFFGRAIEVMRGATALGNYTALGDREAFRIEYWLLEEAKLRRLPADAEMTSAVALVTGGGSGIGRASALRLAAEGAHAVLVDLNAEGARAAAAEIRRGKGSRQALALKADLSVADEVRSAVEEAVLQYGGVDVLVAGAGIARRGTVAETPDADYAALEAVLMRGYFLASREASRVMQAQGGGNVVFVVSKNAVATGSACAVYNAAKAFELHLMRSLAVDLGSKGIRANAVNPDAVLSGSAIWNDRWRTETAERLGIAPEGLQAHYRDRTLMKVNVTAEDVAEAVLFLASARSSRTTGCVVTVDGGVREGFLR